MPCPTSSRTTEYPAASATCCTACPMSPTWLPARAWATPAASASCVTWSKRSASAPILPTAKVAAESACSPSSHTPTSTLSRSPSRKIRCADGIPCTTSALIEVQSVAGKSYSPLNDGRAPGCERMKSSARRSSSSVETPGRMWRRTSASVSATMRLAALAEGGIDELRLGGGTWKAVEDRPFLRLGLRQFLFDEAQDHGVGNELAVVHVLLRLHAERRPGLHGLPQDIARGDLGEAQALRHDLALGTLARSRRAEEENEQRVSAGTARGWSRFRSRRPA